MANIPKRNSNKPLNAIVGWKPNPPGFTSGLTNTGEIVDEEFNAMMIPALNLGAPATKSNAANANKKRMSNKPETMRNVPSAIFKEKTGGRRRKTRKGRRRVGRK